MPDTDDESRKFILRDERAYAAAYWGEFQPRIVWTFAACAAAWLAVIVLGTIGVIPLWLGLIINTILSSMFYMPLHEATHGNILGRRPGSRWGEDLIGMACAIPVGFSYKAHRSSHMRHHAYTNDPDRDPDHYTDGPLRDFPAKAAILVTMSTFLPVFAFIPIARRIVPPQMQRSLRADAGDRRGGVLQLRFWVVSTAVLVIAYFAGFGWPALMLWYLPTRFQVVWLMFIFAWYPHHRADKAGRYVDTRVAVFPGSRWLIRGHDHHAVHHLFPRVPHYRLRALWQDIATDMVAKGTRAEGRATEATGPIIW
ncbi:MAG: fatty acid desaturase [Actinomycetes bacterium]